MAMRTERQGILDRYFDANEIPTDVQGSDEGVSQELLHQRWLQQLSQISDSSGSGGGEFQQEQELTVANAMFGASGLQQGYGGGPASLQSSAASSGGSMAPQLSRLGGDNFFRPRIVPKDKTMEMDRQMRVKKLFKYLDIDGNPIHRISVIDTNQSRTSGYWMYRGERLASGRWHTFSAKEANSLVFVSGLVVGLDKVNIRVQDTDGVTKRWSEQETVEISTITPNERRPDAAMGNFDALANESYNVGNFISASDPDGFAIKKYRVKYTGPGTLTFKGKTIKSGKWVTFRPRDLDKLIFEATGHKSGVKKTTFKVQAYDGRFWSKTDNGKATADPNRNRPINEANDRNVARNEEILGHVLFSADDKDGNTIKKVAFYDTGVQSNGGYFTVNGKKQAARKWFTVDWDDLQKVNYNASSIYDSEKFRVKVYDGKYWSKVVSGTVSTIEKPVIDIDGTTVLDELQPVQVSSLFNQTDAGPGITYYEFIDLNTDPLSGGFYLNDIDLQAGVVHRISASQLDDLTFVGGFVDDRSLDEILIRAKNSEHWSDWERGSVHTEPAMITSLNQLGTWNNAPGQAVEVTFSFLSQVPAYYADDAQERENFQRLNGLMRQAAREALDRWGRLSGISFREVPDSLGGVIRISSADLGDDAILGWAYPPDGVLANFSLAGDVWINNASVLAGTPDDPTTNQSFGSPGFATFVHEFGHAIGLSHPFDQQIRLPSATDSHHYTVMSYQRYASGLEPSAPQLYDVAASQYIYGTNTQTSLGPTTYRFAPSNPIIETIWDGGGVDTFDFSNHVLNLVVDLRPGRFSSYANETDNLNIAYGTEIENLRSGTGNDELHGNHLSNNIFGNIGDDEIHGYGGNDVLMGDEGDDRYHFGLGDGHDTIKEQGAGGWDRLRIDLTGLSGSGDNAFFQNIKARRVNNDLHISLSPRGKGGQGSIVIKGFANEESRIETLELYRGNGQVSRDVDLTSMYIQAGDEYGRFRISDFSSQYGQVALPS